MFKKLFIWPIKLYKKYLSPLLPPSCRYYPTCSTYMIQAIEKHGVILGLIMGIARILRCNPLVKGGYDPVPDYFTLRRNRTAKW
ncbi:MAG: membrane protein insertion efficiency factor YidD [Candidatus Paralactobacillus gallistercoris]|uniref:Putative membrane protein insertion efficiency factor n=1 Tax=Candidatus Paralactobacillus gallistercoris TaxID=2838724 RepID=A0A948TK94_9LACO|nr:membrane protein insertion efficiency factor YidD [Candidatus Paralactobacillus gallistercoris]